MQTRSINEEFMNGSDTDEIIKGLFESFLQKYEENLQEKMDWTLNLMVLIFCIMILLK